MLKNLFGIGLSCLAVFPLAAQTLEADLEAINTKIATQQEIIGNLS